MLSKDQINSLLNEVKNDLAKNNDENEIEKIRIKYLGRKQGIITKLYTQIPKLSLKEKQTIVPKINQLKFEVTKLINERLKNSNLAANRSKTTEKPESDIYLLDPTLPAKEIIGGHKHPTLLIIDEIKEIFHYLGFSWQDGPEIEFDSYNFQKLRIPKNHPARDVQQTYYLDEDILLRTQTSSMQIRYMETHKPPLRMLFPGRVYRREQIDATHLPSFFQVEGLLVDKKTTMTDLIGVLDFFVKKMFGQKSKIRIYGHHFPYTEPSIEVEMLHKNGKWLEILGAGMVHPEVLRNCNIDPKVYRGWAFGMGPERIAMLKYAIEDIRLFYSNDIKFLKQF